MNAAGQAEGSTPISNAKRNYALILMTAVYFFYLLDRNAIIVTQELFKKEFDLTDTQVGMVTGIFYGAAYAMAGLPIGWAIQHVRKVRLLSFLVGIWSLVTLLCGLATQFWHLAVARILVGAAESGGAPTSLSILHPMFPPERRATISSIFFAGAGLGVVVSFLAGGYLAEEYGWRSVFLVYGAPGILLALLILFTLPEPMPDKAAQEAPKASLAEGLKVLLGSRTLRPIYVGAVLYSACNAGVGAWMVSFLMRVHGFQLGNAAAAVSLILGVFGTIGSIVIAMLADRLEKRRRGALLLILALCALLNGAMGIAAVLSNNTYLCLLLFSFWGLTALAYSGPSNAAISEAAPPHMLGMGFSLFAVLCNLLGSSLGPLAVGLISDHYRAELGNEAMRPALVVVCLTQIAAAAAFIIASRRKRSGQNLAANL